MMMMVMMMMMMMLCYEKGQLPFACDEGGGGGGRNYKPCMKHCLPVKNLKCIAKLWIFGIIRDKFIAVENCEN